VVGSQIANLTPDPSFGHNSCFRCPNGSCESILNIYISMAFQWSKNSSIQWVLAPIIALWKFGGPLGLQLPKWEFTWEGESSFSHTFLHSQEHEMWLSGFSLGPQPWKPFVLVASPRLRLWQQTLVNALRYEKKHVEI
jgi:hypothetical protein